MSYNYLVDVSDHSMLSSNPQLRSLAGKYVWWKSPEEALRYPRHVIAQVLNLGTWTDVRTLETSVAPAFVRDVVEHAEPGWFSEHSWRYWHYRLRLAQPAERVPELPKRVSE